MKVEMTKKFQTAKTTTTKPHIYHTSLLLMQATIIKLKKKSPKQKWVCWEKESFQEGSQRTIEYNEVEN